MILVDTPDGNTAEFPDETHPDVIRNAMRSKFGGGPAKNVAQDMEKYSAMSAGDVAKSAVSNIPSSAVEFAKNVAQPVIHPVETAKGLAGIELGVMEKLDKMGVLPAVKLLPGIGNVAQMYDAAKAFGGIEGSGHEQYADAVGRFFKDRYGGVANIKHTIATDPIGFAADLSLFLSPAAQAGAARIPGRLGQVAKVAATPVASTIKGAGGVAAEALGVTTGAGSEAIKTAARAGAEGGEAAKAFREGLSGAADMKGVVEEAKSALGQLRQERGEAYRKSMADIGADKTVLDFDQIDKAVAKVEGVQRFGTQDLSPTTATIRSTIKQAVEGWKNLDPAEYHTPEGLDALKKKIGDIRDGTQYGTPERVVADGIYKAIRKTIVDQAPEYGRAMKAYEEASDLIREIETTLSLKPNANIDTTLRKLQSVLRNNVSTNYGRRQELIDYLSRAGAPHLLEKLAGQTLSTGAPRGLSRAVAGTEGISAMGALAAGHPGVGAALLGGLALSSPALVGGAAHAVGATSRLPLRALGRSAFQAGRLNDAN